MGGRPQRYTYLKFVAELRRYQTCNDRMKCIGMYAVWQKIASEWETVGTEGMYGYATGQTEELKTMSMDVVCAMHHRPPGGLFGDGELDEPHRFSRIVRLPPGYRKPISFW